MRTDLDRLRLRPLNDRNQSNGEEVRIPEAELKTGQDSISRALPGTGECKGPCGSGADAKYRIARLAPLTLPRLNQEES